MTQDHDEPTPTLVDARGLRCPLPVVRAAAAARTLPAGTVLTVVSTDPAAAVDVPAWARMRGHTVVASRTGEQTWEVDVRLGPAG